MVRAPDHEDAVVTAQAVDFVEEERSNGICDDAVEVLEDEVAWCFLAGFREDCSEAVFGWEETGESQTLIPPHHQKDTQKH